MTYLIAMDERSTECPSKQLYRAGQSHLRIFETETALAAAEAVGVCRNAALCRSQFAGQSVGPVNRQHWVLGAVPATLAGLPAGRLAGC